MDLPCFGKRVYLCLRIHRFFCDNPSCQQRTFAEQFASLINRKARRTERVMSQQQQIAFALGGEAGERLCQSLGMPVSADTLIGAIRQAEEPNVSTPRVLGIDDWAKRKGHTYGTVLVDLETHQPVDLLDSRTAEAVREWLQAHPGVEIVSRDRGTEYIKGVTMGAPHAIQVADRWHLLKNLREAVETFVEGKPACLKAAADKPLTTTSTLLMAEENPAPGTTVSEINPPEEKESTEHQPAKPLTKAAQAKAATHARQQARYDQVHALYQMGYSRRKISRQMKLSKAVVVRYLAAECCPHYPEGRKHRSKLAPYLDYLRGQWQAGCTNATQLWREIVSKGFTGSRGLVSRWAIHERKLLPPPNRYSRQQPPEVKPTLSATQATIPWSARRAAWLVVKNPEALEPEEKAALDRLKQTDQETAQVVEMAKQFVEMVKNHQVEGLAGWIQAAIASSVRALVGFANGLSQDLTAVSNALRYPWSSGQTEGQVNRLKYFKRQMFGRANFDLLRKRVLVASIPT
jgi:transposase